MKIESEVIPEHILKRMTPEDRKSFGKAGLLKSEIDAKVIAKSEKQLQDQLQAYLRLRNIVVGRQRMDRKSNMVLGWPDIVFAYRKVPYAWEVKIPGQHPTPDQVETLAQMQENGWQVSVITSVEQAKSTLDAVDKI